ncbi:AAA family ATPase (plasmid) [Streptomyces sp. WC2508]|uniref:AAA family ATPase n=1 Tax=Streptomyces sp. WC2508 TaxID=3461405 RepID=UPI004043D1FB
MKSTLNDTVQPLDTTIPDPALICMIGASGSGKSTLAGTWPSNQVLELDRMRAMVSGCAGDQRATADAVAVLHTVLEARLARKKTTVIDMTSTEATVRARLVQAARRHGVPAVALMVTPPVSVCIERQAARTPERAVPEDVVRRQHAESVAAFPGLRAEGFDNVVFASQVHRLEPLLQRASDTRRADLGWDGHDGLGDLLLVRRFFGSEVLPLWRWRTGSMLAGGDRVGEIRLGPDRLVLALRTDIDGEGGIGFEVLMACPVFADCKSAAWAPVHTATDLLRALTGDLATDPDVYCTDHGPDDPEGRADLEQQYADAVRA